MFFAAVLSSKRMITATSSREQLKIEESKIGLRIIISTFRKFIEKYETTMNPNNVIVKNFEVPKMLMIVTHVLKMSIFKLKTISI